MVSGMKPREEEQKTIRLMIGIYCCAAHGHQRQEPICQECVRLADYAEARLERCPWGEKKPTCARCPAHCYKPDMREAVRNVMRFSGPRMLVHHPVRGIRHLFKGLVPPVRLQKGHP
jgi:hypothetical protein